MEIQQHKGGRRLVWFRTLAFQANDPGFKSLPARQKPILTIQTKKTLFFDFKPLLSLLFHRAFEPSHSTSVSRVQANNSNIANGTAFRRYCLYVGEIRGYQIFIWSLIRRNAISHNKF